MFYNLIKFYLSNFEFIYSLSPDLNSCENVGLMIKSMVSNERPVITTRDDLLSALTAAYEKLRDESFRQFFINLCNSMPKRLEAVRQAEGRHTKY
jgi:hypothetical protein